jgi:hypothetical protein
MNWSWAARSKKVRRGDWIFARTSDGDYRLKSSPNSFIFTSTYDGNAPRSRFFENPGICTVD